MRHYVASGAAAETGLQYIGLPSLYTRWGRKNKLIPPDTDITSHNLAFRPKILILFF